MQGPDKNLVGSVVTKRAPGAIDAAGERGLGDDPTIPDRLYQFVLADNPVMVSHQVNDEIEHLRLDMDGLAKPAQLLLAEVDLEFGKSVFQYHLRCCRCDTTPQQPSDGSAKQPRKNNRFRRKNQGLLKNSAKFERASQSKDGSTLVQSEMADDRLA